MLKCDNHPVHHSVADSYTNREKSISQLLFLLTSYKTSVLLKYTSRLFVVMQLWSLNRFRKSVLWVCTQNAAMVLSFIEDLVEKKLNEFITTHCSLKAWEVVNKRHICIWTHLTTSKMLHFKELVHIYCTAHGLERLPILRFSCVLCALLFLQQ